MIPEQLPPIVVTLATTAAAVIAAYWGTRSKTAQKEALAFETKLRDILDNRLGVPTPETQRLAESEIEAAVTAATPGDTAAKRLNILTLDGVYLAPIPQDVSVIRLLAGATSWLPYRPERFDCEQFAVGFKTLAAFLAGTNTVGIVHDWEANHTYNVIVEADGTARFYEPQEDSFVEPGSGNYSLSGDVMVIF